MQYTEIIYESLHDLAQRGIKEAQYHLSLLFFGNFSEYIESDKINAMDCMIEAALQEHDAATEKI
jgi:hypothetical protein